MGMVPIAQQLVLLVVQWQLVVVQDGSHAGEFDFTALGDIVVLEVRL